MNIRPHSAVAVVAASVLIFSCQNGLNDPLIDGDLLAHSDPGLTLTPFAPGVFPAEQWVPHGTPMVTPDHQELYITAAWGSKRPVRKDIMVMKWSPEGWSEPEITPFSLPEFSEDGVSLSPDGKRLYFTRITHGLETPGPINMQLFMVEREVEGWGVPVEVMSDEAEPWRYWPVPSNSHLFFSQQEPGRNFDICMQSFGPDPETTRLPDGVNSTFLDTWFWVDRKETILMLSSDDESGWFGLMVSVRDSSTGEWGQRRRASRLFLNISYRMPSLSPEEEWLFFNTPNGIYWSRADLLWMERDGALKLVDQFFNTLEVDGIEPALMLREGLKPDLRTVLTLGEEYWLLAGEMAIGRNDTYARRLLELSALEHGRSARQAYLMGHCRLSEGDSIAALDSFEAALTLAPAEALKADIEEVLETLKEKS